jgi:hypothetical protein
VGAGVGVLLILGIVAAIYFNSEIIVKTRKTLFERRSSIRVGYSAPAKDPPRILVACPTYDPHEFDIIDLGKRASTKENQFVESTI